MAMMMASVTMATLLVPSIQNSGNAKAMVNSAPRIKNTRRPILSDSQPNSGSVISSNNAAYITRIKHHLLGQSQRRRRVHDYKHREHVDPRHLRKLQADSDEERLEVLADGLADRIW